MKNFKDYIRLGYYWLEIQYYKIFGLPNEIGVIPEGPYCYVPDVEKNKTHTEPNVIWTKTCPYFRSTRMTGGIACTFEGYFGFDVGLYDQCKICSINNNY